MATTVGLILLSILGIGVLGLTSVLGGGLLLLNLRIIQLLRGEYPPKLVRQFWGLSIVALVLTSIAVVHEYREQSKMSRVDRILRFEGGGPADQWAKNLVNSLPPPLPEIRELVQRGNNIAARVAVEKLGRVGDPDIDAQILFVRFQENRAYNEWWREDIEKAMKQLTDSPLPEGSSVEEWEVFLASWKSEREIESESESENEKTTVGS